MQVASFSFRTLIVLRGERLKDSNKKIGSLKSRIIDRFFLKIIQAEMDILQTDVGDLGGALALGAKVVKSVPLLGEICGVAFCFGVRVR